ncbi:prolyl oligopeptidase family serine peptidase [Opitutaceae bacterium]|nr:prolyl oligopeptidase family serine peptidase [Opitutaceae bacterium]MDB4473793.1 prolyl oligopeptidase family serine peptidase [Opitutaceae bacterium]
MICILGAVVAATASLQAKLDLDRIEPVPEGGEIPAADFFRPAMFSTPQLNPSGTHVAALSSGGTEGMKVLVHHLETSESWVVEGLGELDAIGVSWLDDEMLILIAAYPARGGVALFAVNRQGRGRPYPIVQQVGFTVLGAPLDDRRNLLARLRAGNVTDDRGEVVRLDTSIETATMIDAIAMSQTDRELIEKQNRRAVREQITFLDTGVSQEYVSDGNGNLAFGLVTDAGQISLHAWDGKKWTKSPVDLEAMTVHGAGAEPGQVVVSVHNYDGTVSPVHLMDAATGKLGAEILRDKSYDFHGWIVRDAGTRSMVGLRFDRTLPTFVWYDETYQKLHAMFKGQFPKQVVEIVSVDDAVNVFVLAVHDDRSPVSYHIANLEKRSVGPLKTSRPWLDTKRLSRVSMFKFKTAEGHQLDALITLPQGASRDNPVPLVVLPHAGRTLWGGWSRDVLGYNDTAQFLASRGYGVVQPNYRGTPGTRWMFPEADQWDWRKMSDDVSRATKTALKTKLFDPSRIAIMGQSLGAQLALSGAVHEPDLYACAIGMDGFYDWTQVMRAIQYDVHGNGAYSRLDFKMGSEKQDPEKFRQQSPINFVDQMKAPMLVTQGRDSPELTRHESRRLIGVLNKANVENDSIFTDREGWGRFDLENRLEVYERIESFLAEHL